MENSIQKLIERLAQIAEKYDVVSRCVTEIREVKKEYVVPNSNFDYEIVIREKNET